MQMPGEGILVSGQLCHAHPSARIALSNTEVGTSKLPVTQGTEVPLVHREALVDALRLFSGWQRTLLSQLSTNL